MHTIPLSLPPDPTTPRSPFDHIHFVLTSCARCRFARTDSYVADISAAVASARNTATNPRPGPAGAAAAAQAAAQAAAAGVNRYAPLLFVCCSFCTLVSSICVSAVLYHSKTWCWLSSKQQPRLTYLVGVTVYQGIHERMSFVFVFCLVYLSNHRRPSYPRISVQRLMPPRPPSDSRAALTSRFAFPFAALGKL